MMRSAIFERLRMTRQKTSTDTELAAFRRQIDEIDDKIIDLLIERTGIVGRVGELKRKAAPGRCPIRPGREAEMLRRIMKNSKTPFLARRRRRHLAHHHRHVHLGGSAAQAFGLRARPR